MDIETLYAIVEVCNASEKLRAANPRAATPAELEEMGLNYQMTQGNELQCTCIGSCHLWTDKRCAINWWVRSMEVH